MDLSSWKKYRGDGRSAVFVSSEILPPKRTVNYTIKVKGWEKKPGPDALLTTETKTGTFHTAQFPDYIAAEHFISTTPGYRQRYFLKNEWPKGTMKLKYDYSTLFDPEFWYEEQWELGNYVNTAITGSFEWKMRYKELATNEIKERTCTINGDGTLLSFNIPNGLSNEEIYTLDLRVIFHPTPNTLTAGSQDGSNTYDSYKDVLISGSSGSVVAIDGLTFNPGGNDNTGQHQPTMLANNPGTQAAAMSSEHSRCLQVIIRLCKKPTLITRYLAIIRGKMLCIRPHKGWVCSLTQLAHQEGGSLFSE